MIGDSQEWRGEWVRQNAIVAGVGMTPFGKHLDVSLQTLAHQAIREALQDCGVEPSDIQAAWVGSAAAGAITGQHCVAGQAILRSMGIGGIPVVNVENACATASTAFQQACSHVTFGAYDVVLAVGVDKLFHPDKGRTMGVYAGCIDVEARESMVDFIRGGPPADPPEGARSFFMDIYDRLARDYMQHSGATREDFARISAKNSVHGSLNPLAQYRGVLSIEDVLAARPITAVLTLPMCSPIGDGAAAAVIVSPRKARALGIADQVHVRASNISSGSAQKGSPIAQAATACLADAGIGPADLHCLETHDATAPAELMQYEDIGLCAPGGGPALLASGDTALGGRIPVNVSGGLVRKGHPIGATGLAQIYELTNQLRGRGGARQVPFARIAMAENGGGFIGAGEAAIVMTVLGR